MCCAGCRQVYSGVYAADPANLHLVAPQASQCASGQLVDICSTHSVCMQGTADSLIKIDQTFVADRTSRLLRNCTKPKMQPPWPLLLLHM
jgi:hypothetical protein